MTVSKAIVAQVQIGLITIEGLMAPNGDFGVGVSQIAEHFSLDKTIATREVKSLLGKGLQLDKWKSELNSNPVNVISIKDFKKLVRALDRKGNILAEALTDALLEESIERRFARAFNVKFDEDEAEKRLALRMGRIISRFAWTDVIKKRHYQITGRYPSSDYYRSCTIMVNKKLFGRPHFNCNRDNMTPEQQQLISDFERMAQRKSKQYPDLPAHELLMKIIELF